MPSRAKTTRTVSPSCSVSGACSPSASPGAKLARMLTVGTPTFSRVMYAWPAALSCAAVGSSSNSALRSTGSTRLKPKLPAAFWTLPLTVVSPSVQ